jgi:PleD family two-component response regulator
MNEAGRRPMVVLLVDDQAFICAAVSRLLANEPDIELHTCQDPRRAAAMAHELRPTVILQDLVMPEIDGFALIAAYRGSPTTMTVPIIALSGNDDATTRTRALEAGANDFIVKLPPKDRLIAFLRKQAGEPEVAEAPKVSADPPVSLDARAREAIDSHVIAKLRELGAEDFVRTLIGQFLEEAGTRIHMLKDAAERRDENGLKVSAHSLKGSSKMMGAMRLAGLCLELEQHVEKYSSGQNPAALLIALDQELGRVRDALGAEVSAGRHPSVERGKGD